MFLSEEDLRALTGATTRQKQRKWLTEHNYPFEINAAGYHIVLKSLVEQRLGGQIEFSPKPKKPGKQPNLTPRQVH
jgi:hypothetical protein